MLGEFCAFFPEQTIRTLCNDRWKANSAKCWNISSRLCVIALFFMSVLRANDLRTLASKQRRSIFPPYVFLQVSETGSLIDWMLRIVIIIIVTVVVACVFFCAFVQLLWCSFCSWLVAFNAIQRVFVGHRYVPSLHLCISLFLGQHTIWMCNVNFSFMHVILIWSHWWCDVEIEVPNGTMPNDFRLNNFQHSKESRLHSWLSAIGGAVLTSKTERRESVFFCIICAKNIHKWTFPNWFTLVQTERIKTILLLLLFELCNRETLCDYCFSILLNCGCFTVPVYNREYIKCFGLVCLAHINALSIITIMCNHALWIHVMLLYCYCKYAIFLLLLQLWNEDNSWCVFVSVFIYSFCFISSFEYTLTEILFND